MGLNAKRCPLGRSGAHRLIELKPRPDRSGRHLVCSRGCGYDQVVEFGVVTTYVNGDDPVQTPNPTGAPFNG